MSTPEARARASKKYNAKSYEQISFRVRQDGSDGFDRDLIASEAEKHGESINQYIVKAIRERIMNG